MKLRVLLNDAPYGSERTFNGLRLAKSLAMKEGVELHLFLIGDAVGAARAGQKVPPGYYNTEQMVKSIARRAVSVGVCGTCIDARGIAEADLVPGCHRGSLEELTEWTLSAAKVLVF